MVATDNLISLMKPHSWCPDKSHKTTLPLLTML